ncbi:SMI1/KNR4 family protein [Streptosporangium sp. DT93]|uniref:SMI1/KNR4 family protein n=1 Tax=Streptosporangium sp. DT93 TaxID=3393428 RepID=UPI003CEBFE36
MRRLITSRGVRLAFAFGAAATVVVAVVAVVTRLRRSPARRVPLRHHDPAAEPSSPVSTGSPSPARAGSPSPARAQTPAEAGSGPVPPWPPVPVLGVPTAEELRRYDAGPSAFRSAVEGFFTRTRPPREPLDEATLRRLRRWGAAGLAFLLLLGGVQALEAAVFSPGASIESSQLYEDGSCSAGVRVDPPAFTVCMDESEAGAFTDPLPVPDPVTPEVFPEMSEPAPPEPAPGPSADADCRPVTAAPRVRPVDPRVTRAVNRQWRRIERWLAANAPESRRTLGEPGRAGTIAVAEAQTGLRFPDSLRASLLRHDGSFSSGDTWAFGFQGDANLSVRGIRDTWRMLCGIDARDESETDSPGPRSEWWDGRMIPISADGLGNHLVIDSVERDVGQTDHEGIMDFTVGGTRIRSYHALLKATADALETGGSVGYMRPVVVGGKLEWEVDELSPFANPDVSGAS